MKPNATDITLAYYDANAMPFVEATQDVEFDATRKRFTSLLPPGAAILDFGCGSGRDAKAFLDEGFDVTATDGSEELCRVASELCDIPIRHELFQELADTRAYDGVWACSSILHLPKDQLANVLRRIEQALVPSGVLYTSFKVGSFEGLRNGRYFTDFEEPAFRAFVDASCGLEIKDLWISGDVRPGRGDERWLNAILYKVAVRELSP
jgi:SAM-dependent methyltransferase